MSTKLSEEVKDRIRLEEQFRMQVRAEQEEEEPTSNKSSDAGLLGFLNTKLGLAVLTTLLIPALGGLYAHMQQRATERAAENRQIVKLLTEFDWRLAEIDYQREKIPNEANPDKWASAAYIWRAIIGDNAFIPTEPAFQHVHLAGIVSQLKSIGFEDPGDVAFTTIKQMESGGQGVLLTDQPPLQNHTYDVQVLNRQLQVLRAFRSRVAPRHGFWGLIW